MLQVGSESERKMFEGVGEGKQSSFVVGVSRGIRVTEMGHTHAVLHQRYQMRYFVQRRV